MNRPHVTKTRPNHPMGEQRIYSFPNGYSASVVIGPYSYGGDKGLYELAVMQNGGIDYSTPITDDVLGYLTPEGVTEALDAIEALPTPMVGRQP